MTNKRLAVLLLVVLLSAYIASYLFLSRRGYAAADRLNMVGFYYLPYDDSDTWRGKNQLCTYLFWPLNLIDRSLGFGRLPGAEPLRGIHSAPNA
jgi:hypothetical protein